MAVPAPGQSRILRRTHTMHHLHAKDDSTAMTTDQTRFPVKIQTVPYIRRNTEIYYPQVFGMTNPAVQQRINHTIQLKTRELIERQNESQVEGVTTMTGYYELKTNERAVLSLTQLNFA
jgi:hypothetical protein